MDSILWPCHNIEWLPHISITHEDNFLGHNNVFNLY